MPVSVADVRANLNETIRHAAEIIGRSDARRDVFEAIYRGKRQVKSVDELMKATGLSHKRVLEEGGKLAGNDIVQKVKVGGRVAYKKYETYTHHKKRVLELVADPAKKTKYPTKQEPRSGAPGTTYKVVLPRSTVEPKEITVDDIEAFKSVKAIPQVVTPKVRLQDIPEKRVKRFLMRVIGETYGFKDWGGEKNDLRTNKLRFRGARRGAAIAIKGKATTGPLTPKKMGKNGDQIGRLMSSDAQVFLVVYHGKIDQSIHEQMRAFALGRAAGGNRVYYGAIDGSDLARLIEAYPNEFSASAKP